ncbi:hypothetical protein CEE87_12765, partial [Lactobacillus crispatus]
RIGRAGFGQRDVGGERAGAGSGIELEHVDVLYGPCRLVANPALGFLWNAAEVSDDVPCRPPRGGPRTLPAAGPPCDDHGQSGGLFMTGLIAGGGIGGGGAGGRPAPRGGARPGGGGGARGQAAALLFTNC